MQVIKQLCCKQDQRDPNQNRKKPPSACFVILERKKMLKLWKIAWSDSQMVLSAQVWGARHCGIRVETPQAGVAARGLILLNHKQRRHSTLSRV